MNEFNTINNILDNFMSYPVLKQMKIIRSDDGSNTIYLKELNECYHSMKGAVTESNHVFIKAGLNYIKENELTIFEVGFGTGLNALLTLLTSEKSNLKIKYYTNELHPLKDDIIRKLNYPNILFLDEINSNRFYLMHSCTWNKDIKLTDNLLFHKIKGDMATVDIPEQIKLVYFDAFSPDKQPEMWTKEIFIKLYRKMSANSVLTTYCAKGEFKRVLKSVGFYVESLSGPPGKREMVRAIKH